MSDVNDLIEGARRGSPGEHQRGSAGHMIGSLADALEAEHAEVERLRGDNTILGAALTGARNNASDWFKEFEREHRRAERAEAELHDREVRLDEQRKMTERAEFNRDSFRRQAEHFAERGNLAEAELLRARAISELLRHENATLTAQLQDELDTAKGVAAVQVARIRQDEAEIKLYRERFRDLRVPEDPKLFSEMVEAERVYQRQHGYTPEHDAEHGIEHLLSWALDYLRRGRPQATAGLIQAAIEFVKVHARLTATERESRLTAQLQAARDAWIRIDRLNNRIEDRIALDHALTLDAAADGGR